jgi:hypothetical protein
MMSGTDIMGSTKSATSELPNAFRLNQDPSYSKWTDLEARDRPQQLKIHFSRP